MKWVSVMERPLTLALWAIVEMVRRIPDPALRASFGACLTALGKKTGAVQTIAISGVFRQIVAKVADNVQTVCQDGSVLAATHFELQHATDAKPPCMLCVSSCRTLLAKSSLQI